MRGTLNTAWVVESLSDLGKQQQELARAVGLSPSKLSRTLRGDRRLQVHEMFALCDFLQISVGEAQHRLLGESAPTAEVAAPVEEINATADLEELIETVARCVLEANEKYGDPQSPAQLASTIAKFATDFKVDPKDFPSFEQRLEEAIRTAVRYTPKPRLGGDDV